MAMSRAGYGYHSLVSNNLVSVIRVEREPARFPPTHSTHSLKLGYICVFLHPVSFGLLVGILSGTIRM